MNEHEWVNVGRVLIPPLAWQCLHGPAFWGWRSPGRPSPEVPGSWAAPPGRPWALVVVGDLQADTDTPQPDESSDEVQSWQGLGQAFSPESELDTWYNCKHPNTPSRSDEVDIVHVKLIRTAFFCFLLPYSIKKCIFDHFNFNLVKLLCEQTHLIIIIPWGSMIWCALLVRVRGGWLPWVRGQHTGVSLLCLAVQLVCCCRTKTNLARCSRWPQTPSVCITDIGFVCMSHLLSSSDFVQTSSENLINDEDSLYLNLRQSSL